MNGTWLSNNCQSQTQRLLDSITGNTALILIICVKTFRLFP